MLNSTTLYLSGDGNDNFDGLSPERAVKTFDKINELAKTNSRPISVKVMGDYYLLKTAVINCSNLTIEPYGEKARIIGGKKLEGWQKDFFNDKPCYSLFIPEVKSGEWTPTDLYAGNKRATLCRYPKTGTLQVETTQHPNSTTLFCPNDWFVAKKEDLSALSGVEDAIVSFHHFWIDEHTPVESYDEKTGKIVMAFRSRFAITPKYDKNEDSASGMRYYLENLPCAFSLENDWYLDKKSGKAYYIPKNTDDFSTLEFFAPTLTTLIKVEGNENAKVTGVRFENIDFLCSKGDYESRTFDTSVTSPETEKGFAGDAQAVFGASGAVVFRYALGCHLSKCKFYALGLHAVELRKGCVSIAVEDCSFTHLGGGAIKIYGTKDEKNKADESRENAIRNNEIFSCGERYEASCGILIMDSPFNLVENNEISYLGYTGISSGWVWGYDKSVNVGTIIRNNHIHHIGRGTLSDMGGIYLLGDQEGALVEGNHIHDIDGACYGAWGIYTDEGSRGATIRDNLVYNCKNQCFHQHYGKNNIVKNNIFAFGGASIVHLTKTEEHIGVFLENNTLISCGTPIYSWHTKFSVTPPYNLFAKNNTVFDITKNEPTLCFVEGAPLSLLEWQTQYNKDEGSEVKLPSFIQIDGKTIRKIK